MHCQRFHPGLSFDATDAFRRTCRSGTNVLFHRIFSNISCILLKKIQLWSIYFLAKFKRKNQKITKSVEFAKICVKLSCSSSIAAGGTAPIKSVNSISAPDSSSLCPLSSVLSSFSSFLSSCPENRSWRPRNKNKSKSNGNSSDEIKLYDFPLRPARAARP